MLKIELTPKKIASMTLLGAFLIFMLFVGISEQISIGQKYVRVYFNDEEIACVNNHVDVKKVLQEARRELAAESDHILSIDYELSTVVSDELFVPLMEAETLKENFKEELIGAEITTCARSYTVAIEGYRGNFNSLEEVYAFLDTVKSEVDTEQQFMTNISKENGHISGILTAQLVETNAIEKEVIPEHTLADDMVAGIFAENMQLCAYALANPDDGSYDVGMQDMEFVETVEIYENYVTADELSDVQTEVEEVTKEKETNKIYVVESGDCLSIIAMEHETTVKDIMALNNFDNENVPICAGDELIVAVPEPDLSLRTVVGVVYEEDYNADPIIIENDSWYTTQEVIHEEGTTGHRERNDIVTYENGIEVSRELVHQTIMVESTPAVIERGTITPPTYIKPLSGGRKSSGYGKRWGRMHKGIDWACSVGTTIYASSAGTVLSAGYSSSYGYNVLISHPDGKMTRYAHCSQLLVSAGQYVEQGETIAKSGNTGRSTGPHLHFEIYVNGVAVNPEKYISY